MMKNMTTINNIKMMILTFYLLLITITTINAQQQLQQQHHHQQETNNLTNKLLQQQFKTTNLNQNSNINLNLNTNNLNDNQIRYDVPDDCHYQLLNSNKNDISLICNLRTINSEYDTTNFSVIPSENTISLKILCNDDIMAKSYLESKSFIHLTKLQDLTIDYCKLTKFSSDILIGLNNLKNLTIRTHNINWPDYNLNLNKYSFNTTKNLERLDLSKNNIWDLNDNIFCNLNELNFLNISENRLQDINELSFRDNIKENNNDDDDENEMINENNNSNVTNKITGSIGDKNLSKTSIKNVIGSKDERNLTKLSKKIKQNVACNNLDLEILDVSHNHFVLLPANGFGILKRLKTLRLNNNEISMVADKALSGLKNLQILNLSSNKIVALPSELFSDCSQSIQEVYLQNNSISVLSPKLFASLEQLQALDLSYNQITSTWIDKTTFQGLIRLVLLNLSHNKITKLEPEIFTDLYTLQILNLRYNQLDNIASDTFSLMSNLHTLLLSHNKLKYLDAYALNGLYVLSLLSLDNNALIGVHPEAFRNCSTLQDLNLNGNQLKSIPLAIRNMRLLRTIDLGENSISLIEDTSFRGLSNLYGLRLIGNYLENVTINCFKDLPSLQILNLARNRLQFIEPGSFEMTGNIQAIRIDGNELTDIQGLFSNMPNLLWLNISDNRLETFDYSQIPNGLQWLDIHKNVIIELTNRLGIDSQIRLQTLDASFNQITKVTPLSIPNSIELLFLNDNLIISVEPHTFMDKTNLTRVDLYANQITTLDIKALRIKPLPNDHIHPEFYIGGNPFICDCNIDWLQKINYVTTRQYPKIMDLETIYCKLLNNRERAYISLIDAEPKHFLCAYKTHCFALCHCCEFDACDCEMTCPNNCTCFHDQSWSTNVVECSNAGYNEIPTNIPMDTTEVYIDGNDLIELSGHSFIGRKNLLVLYANNSNIQVIYNTTFSGLKRLTILHLEENKIYRLHGNEFYNLENLKELYLHNNRITFITNGTFINMRKLEVLRLDGNRLMQFEVWQLALNPYLVEIGLADNMWSCECSYLSRFRNYLQSSSEKIIDANRVACVYNNMTSILKEEKNGTKCTLRDGISTYVRNNEIENLLPLLLTATCAFIGFFGLILGLFCYRQELSIWAQKHCSLLRLCCFKTSANYIEDYDKDRLYDAYISYSLQDEHFVNHILGQTLESDIGYHLCLHYRDINLNLYITDGIIDAVESSKQTIIVISKNFLYNEWTRFEYKSALHEIIKRRKRLLFILYGDLPQRDIDTDMRHYLRTNTCIEWNDKKFWQKLRIALPHIRKRHCLTTSAGTTRNSVNIYATPHEYGPIATGPSLRNDFTNSKRYDCANYATITDCQRNYNSNYASNFDSISCNKYNTLNDSSNSHHHLHHHLHNHQQQSQQKNNLGINIKTIDRKHEYAAIPSIPSIPDSNQASSTLPAASAVNIPFNFNQDYTSIDCEKQTSANQKNNSFEYIPGAKYLTHSSTTPTNIKNSNTIMDCNQSIDDSISSSSGTSINANILAIYNTKNSAPPPPPPTAAPPPAPPPTTAG